MAERVRALLEGRIDGMNTEAEWPNFYLDMGGEHGLKVDVPQKYRDAPLLAADGGVERSGLLLVGVTVYAKVSKAGEAFLKLVWTGLHEPRATGSVAG